MIPNAAIMSFDERFCDGLEVIREFFFVKYRLLGMLHFNKSEEFFLGLIDILHWFFWGFGQDELVLEMLYQWSWNSCDDTAEVFERIVILIW